MTTHMTTDTESNTPATNSRRGFFALGTKILGGLLGLGVAIPGIAFLLDPLRRKLEGGGFRALPVSLDELTVGVPVQVPIIEAAKDAWVTYPSEPLGSIWLVRQTEGAEPPVVVFTAECPHLGCAITLSSDARSFFCPCHQSAFALDGERMNATPPRGMDRLEIAPVRDPKAAIQVRFQRFQTLSKEKIPLV